MLMCVRVAYVSVHSFRNVFSLGAVKYKQLLVCYCVIVCVFFGKVHDHEQRAASGPVPMW